MQLNSIERELKFCVTMVTIIKWSLKFISDSKTKSLNQEQFIIRLKTSKQSLICGKDLLFKWELYYIPSKFYIFFHSKRDKDKVVF